MRLYLQPSLFTCEGEQPLYAEVTVIRASGAVSVGVTLRSLHSLDLLAQTAELRYEDGDGRDRCHDAVDALFDCIAELDAVGPFDH